jgi:uncharacterized protein YbjT (DUF2867 family)
MAVKTVAVIGGTGMIGKSLVQHLIIDRDVTTIKLLVRRPMEKPHEKIEVKLVDFADRESVQLALEESQVVFCAIGTTQKNVQGNKQLYRKIDVDIPVMAAKCWQEVGFDQFVIVSSIGATADSKNFYLQLKGEAEAGVIATGIPMVHIMQPSMLLGKREEKRPMENFLQATMRFTSGLFFGSWRQYRAIEGNTVAKAMLQAAKLASPGVHRYTFDAINKLADSNY